MPIARHRRLAVTVALVVPIVLGACGGGDGVPDESERRAIADTISARLEEAYDFSADSGAAEARVVERLMSLYPDEGRVVSAAAGRVTTSRDSLERQVRHFWEWVGTNMVAPRTRWGPRHVDVLSRTSALVTTTYAIEHRTPRGEPHTLAGAWTALFQKRGGRWVIVQEHLSDVPAAAAAPSSDTTHAHGQPR